MTPPLAPSGIVVIAGGAALAIVAADARSVAAARAFSADFIVHSYMSSLVGGRRSSQPRTHSNAEIAAKFRPLPIYEPLFIQADALVAAGAVEFPTMENSEDTFDALQGM